VIGEKLQYKLKKQAQIKNRVFLSSHLAARKKVSGKISKKSHRYYCEPRRRKKEFLDLSTENRR
jgi:hypothetical protein